MAKSHSVWHVARNQDFIGVRFGRLVVAARAGSSPSRDRLWLCQCDCGNTKTVPGCSLKNGGTRSCGCLMREVLGTLHRTHGATVGRATPEYQCWRQMYGNKEAIICDHWKGKDGFSHFLADMGNRPSPKHFFTRRDCKSGYCPQNCFWATKDERIFIGRGNVNVAYFDTWSANMAYILGYTWADGSVAKIDKRSTAPGRISYGCVEDDREILDFIKEELNSTSKIGYIANPKGFPRDIPNRTARPQVRLKIDSIRLVTSLIERHGLAERKSYLDLPFPDVPSEWLPHFVRGFLDGDGTIAASKHRPHQCKIGFVGTPKWITGLRDRLMQTLDLYHVKVHADRRVALHAKIMWGSRADGLRLHAFLYPSGDDYFWLKRKRDKCEKLLCVGAYSHLASQWKPRGHWRQGIPDPLPPLGRD